MGFLNLLPTIITTIFFLTLFSYYIILLIPKKNQKIVKSYSSISVIIPAHNEQEFISDCITSVLEADFKGKKQIIVVDDGSSDNTVKIVEKFQSKQVELIKTNHTGKSDSINTALKNSTGELIAIVDADSYISKNSLTEMAKEVGKNNIVGASCVVKVKNKKKFLCLWPQVELLYNSLIRSILTKIGANIVTPGPLAVYRKKELLEIDGFSTDGFSEDIDVTIRLIRKGYKIGFSEKAVSETNMPYKIKEFLRQRFRFARGMLKVFKKHLQINKTIIDLYSLPLFVFMYIQAIIMGSFTIYQIINGYLKYFVSQGIFFSYHVFTFFLDWFTILGFIKWFYGIFLGTTPLNLVNIIGIFATMLSYPLFIHSAIKFNKKLDIIYLIPFFLMAPFWWFLTIIYLIALPEMFRKKQYNIWKKNE